MNIFFGIASNGPDGRFDFMRSNIEKLFGQDSKILSSIDKSFCCGYIEDGGSILGTARNGQHYLLFSGMLQLPLPEWKGHSPLDNPNESAQYLLNLYLSNGAKPFWMTFMASTALRSTTPRKQSFYWGVTLEDSGGYFFAKRINPLFLEQTSFP